MTSPVPVHFTLTRQDSTWVLHRDPAGSQAALSLDPSGVVIDAEAMVIDHPAGGDAELYRHGWTSWSPTAWWRQDRDPWRVWDNPERTATAEEPATDRYDRHRSYLLTAVVLPSQPGDNGRTDCLLIGRLGGRTGVLDLLPGRIQARTLAHLTGQGGAAPFPPGSSSDVAWWVGVGPELEVFERWAHALADSVGLPVETPARRDDPGPVWSSWYSWFEEITAERIEAEILPAAANGYGVVQIDDGWQRAVGDWEPNGNFPEGMAALADHIHHAGMEAGLWLAPFIVSARSPLARQRPELLVRTESGEPAVAGYNWAAPYYALDCTHPEALDWIRELVGRITQWGYGYLKLDFLNAAAICGLRHRRVDREAAYRLGLEAIRGAAPDAYLMASGAVIAPSLGVVDGMRVGPDTAPYWDNTERRRDPSGPAVRNALRAAVARSWLSRIVDTDPDVAFARSRGSLLSPEACAVTRDMALVSGVVGCSDPDAWLTDAERDQIRELCGRARTGARVRALGRYRFEVDGRIVDFEPWINPPARMSDRILAK
ncbi:glycoside hydrolase family 36 protein [Actinomyces qiguomingii]|uniref:glycoside hydrolase family 36 protein n=1 Tax=Actinomyces qiguomingii TaxID=2057800 RepID=UPI000FFE9A1A|nr:glycoside hydrolase family 36 protein [Actinomyces qiguomingii]